MIKNVGKIDASVRIVVGLAIILLGFVYASWWGLIGIIPLATASVRFCPIFTIFGINTCKKV